MNPAYEEPYRSCLQELSKTHFSIPSSDFITTPPETLQSSNDVHTLSYNDMSPAEILASIPQYNSETISMPTTNFSLEDKLFPKENVATSTLHSPDSRAEEAGNNQPNNESPNINASTNLPDTSESHSRTAEPCFSENERKQFISSTPISDLSDAFSSDISSDIISCSSYSGKSLEQGSTEAIHFQNNPPPTELKNEVGYSTANEDEPLGFNCFCGDIDNDMMIACEGDHGESEFWFHYHCAGIDVVPDG